MIDLQLVRRFFTLKATEGDLTVDGIRECVTLSLPARNRRRSVWGGTPISRIDTPQAVCNHCGAGENQASRQHESATNRGRAGRDSAGSLLAQPGRAMNREPQEPSALGIPRASSPWEDVKLEDHSPWSATAAVKVPGRQA